MSSSEYVVPSPRVRVSVEKRARSEKEREHRRKVEQDRKRRRMTERALYPSSGSVSDESCEACAFCAKKKNGLSIVPFVSSPSVVVCANCKNGGLRSFCHSCGVPRYTLEGTQFTLFVSADRPDLPLCMTCYHDDVKMLSLFSLRVEHQLKYLESEGGACGDKKADAETSIPEQCSPAPPSPASSSKDFAFPSPSPGFFSFSPQVIGGQEDRRQHPFYETPMSPFFLNPSDVSQEDFESFMIGGGGGVSDLNFGFDFDEETPCE